jgi:FixJ family two-component response regulator
MAQTASMNSPVPARSADIPADARRRLILVDDDDSARRSLQLLLSAHGFDVRSFAAAAPILADPQAIDAPFLVVDQHLPVGDGVSLIAALRERGWRGRAVMITGFPSRELSEAADRQGCPTVLEKPLRGGELLRALGERLPDNP